MQKKIWKWFPPNYPLVFSVMDFPGESGSRESASNARDLGSIPGLGRAGEGEWNPLQYSCLENLMDRGANFCSLK